MFSAEEPIKKIIPKREKNVPPTFSLPRTIEETDRGPKRSAEMASVTPSLGTAHQGPVTSTRRRDHHSGSASGQTDGSTADGQRHTREHSTLSCPHQEQPDCVRGQPHGVSPHRRTQQPRGWGVTPSQDKCASQATGSQGSRR